MRWLWLQNDSKHMFPWDLGLSLGKFFLLLEGVVFFLGNFFLFILKVIFGGTSFIP
jgi:hypothetical protein